MKTATATELCSSSEQEAKKQWLLLRDSCSQMKTCALKAARALHEIAYAKLWEFLDPGCGGMQGFVTRHSDQLGFGWKRAQALMVFALLYQALESSPGVDRKLLQQQTTYTLNLLPTNKLYVWRVKPDRYELLPGAQKTLQEIWQLFAQEHARGSCSCHQAMQRAVGTYKQQQQQQQQQQQRWSSSDASTVHRASFGGLQQLQQQRQQQGSEACIADVSKAAAAPLADSRSVGQQQQQQQQGLEACTDVVSRAAAAPLAGSTVAGWHEQQGSEACTAAAPGEAAVLVVKSTLIGQKQQLDVAAVSSSSSKQRKLDGTATPASSPSISDQRDDVMTDIGDQQQQQQQVDIAPANSSGSSGQQLQDGTTTSANSGGSSSRGQQLQQEQEQQDGTTTPANSSGSSGQQLQDGTTAPANSGSSSSRGQQLQHEQQQQAGTAATPASSSKKLDEAAATPTSSARSSGQRNRLRPSSVLVAAAAAGDNVQLQVASLEQQLQASKQTEGWLRLLLQMVRRERNVALAERDSALQSAGVQQQQQQQQQAASAAAPAWSGSEYQDPVKLGRATVQQQQQQLLQQETPSSCSPPPSFLLVGEEQQQQQQQCCQELQSSPAGSFHYSVVSAPHPAAAVAADTCSTGSSVEAPAAALAASATDSDAESAGGAGLLMVDTRWAARRIVDLEIALEIAQYHWGNAISQWQQVVDDL